MKIIPPKPFTFEAGPRAVLLLHGFTGNSADVRMMGRFLQKKGYTCHAPIYKGHGQALENILEYDPEDWWEDVTAAYGHLKNLGHTEIAVGGLSLGGVFSLKLGYTVPIKGIIPMCAPMYFRSEESMSSGLIQHAREYKELEGKSKKQVGEEIERIKQLPTDTFKGIQDLVKDVRDHIDHIYAPTLVVQARNDEIINPDSANVIYENVESNNKHIKWYEESSHVITLAKEKEQFHEDVFQFLEGLDWDE
jgi:carboxylesterase